MTAKTEHTPGPWEAFVGESGEVLAVFAGRKPTGEAFEVVHSAGFSASDVWSVAERRANVRLIAAAPELLEALRAVTDLCEIDPDLPAAEKRARVQIINAARATIAAATGKEG